MKHTHEIKNISSNANPIYTVILEERIKGVRYVVGSKTVDKDNLDAMINQGAQLLHADVKNPKLVTVIINNMRA